MSLHESAPIVDTWVKLTNSPNKIGRVLRVWADDNTTKVEVDWLGNSPNTIHDVQSLQTGLQKGFCVQNKPTAISRSTLGPGIIRDTRRIANVDMALVQLSDDSRLVWLPAFSLVRIMDARLRFLRSQMSHRDSGERWALNMMASALRTWNEATGALDRLDVDPLPHQIQLVHHIISSGHTNWIIGDDVGLGKTIEVGLLLGALERRNQAKRILIITPASLTRQWQDEMRLKFNRTYEIYERDFSVDEVWKWKLHDRVIASLDMLKPNSQDDEGSDFATHFGKLLTAESWDIVIFDEGHRLSRDDRGSQTLRYKLARGLRERCKGLILLSGTPHQGDTGKFRSLLKLVRPDLNEALELLEFQPAVVGEIVLRNRKIDVTDAEGNFIFVGHTVRRVDVPSNEPMLNLARQLEIYLRRGYAAGNAVGGSTGRAIGFVMTIYRKLAASSVYALHIALQRRLARLTGMQTTPNPTEAKPFDFDVEGEEGDDPLTSGFVADFADAFFENEEEMLKLLIRLATRTIAFDTKFDELLALARETVVERKSKLLVFTEYRATQNFIVKKLSSILGEKIAVINGSQKLDEKLQNVADFDNDAAILVSTEAGGEGLNLQRQCNILVNYDLPWNPARLVQRIGRLYRYGQAKHVIVINLHVNDTIDNEIINLALLRVDAISREMAVVSPEFRENYANEIFGELLEQLDLSQILEAGIMPERAQDRIDDAVEKARKAREMQNDVLASAVKFDPDSLIRLGSFATAHVAEFIRRAAPYVGVTVEESKDKEKFVLRLPDDMKGRYPEFGGRWVIEATTNRSNWSYGGKIMLLDFQSAFVRDLVTRVMEPDFGGSYAATNGLWPNGTLVCGILGRLQNESGEVTGDELMVLRREPTGQVVRDNATLAPLFAGKVPTATPNEIEPKLRQDQFDAIYDRAEVELQALLNTFRLPADLFLIGMSESGEAIETSA